MKRKEKKQKAHLVDELFAFLIKEGNLLSYHQIHE